MDAILVYTFDHRFDIRLHNVFRRVLDVLSDGIRPRKVYHQLDRIGVAVPVVLLVVGDIS